MVIVYICGGVLLLLSYVAIYLFGHRNGFANGYKKAQEQIAELFLEVK